MGNTSFSLKSSNHEIKKSIECYKTGDIDEFQNIMNKSNPEIQKNEYFQAWKIGCLYHFLVNLQESEHDIGDSQSKIISKFKEFEGKTFRFFKSDNEQYKTRGLKLAKSLYIATHFKKFKIF